MEVGTAVGMVENGVVEGLRVVAKVVVGLAAAVEEEAMVVMDAVMVAVMAAVMAAVWVVVMVQPLLQV